MGVNKAEQRFEDRLIRKVLDNEKQMADLKAANQPAGADILGVSALPSDGIPIGTGTVTVPSGGTVTVTINAFPFNDILTLWNSSFTIYVDAPVGPLTSSDKWPDGSNMTAAKRNLKVTHWLDYHDSFDATGKRAFKLFIRNDDVSSHTVFVSFMFYLPELGGSSIA